MSMITRIALGACSAASYGISRAYNEIDFLAQQIIEHSNRNTINKVAANVPALDKCQQIQNIDCSDTGLPSEVARCKELKEMLLKKSCKRTHSKVL